ncbi:hypothetical protein [Sphingomonas sp. 3-13AW]|uniref:hypothetical protein n=1 Tax=Sphingomonas sp. 3-13AW TaxID=3050450 RepID=UPI003BB76C7A
MKMMSAPGIMKPQHGLLEEAGDQWMRSLRVSVSCESTRLEIDGAKFEALMLAMQIRHLAVHPRSRDIIPGSMPASRFSARVDNYWSSIEAHDLCDVALQVQSICRGGDIDWRLP